MKKTAGMILVLLILAASLQAAWTTKRLTNNTGDSDYPDIAVWSENVYTAWNDDTPGNYEIFFRRSTNGGATWDAETQMTFTSLDSFAPSLAASGPYVYLAYEDDTATDAEIHFRRSTDSGATWGPDITLTNNTGDSWNPTVAVSGPYVYVVWCDNTPGNFEIYFRRSTDYGQTWDNQKRLTTTSGDSGVPRIAASGPDVYVVWYDDTPENNEIYFRRSTDYGNSWVTARKLTTTIGDSYMPDVEVLNSIVVVTWDDWTPGNYEVYVRRSTDKGANWEAARRLTNNSGVSGFPRLGGKAPNLYVAWHDDTPGNYDVYYRKSTDNGATWSGSARVKVNDGLSDHPAVALTSSKAFIIWRDQTPGNPDIYLVYSPL